MDLICEERPSESPLVERVWYSRSEAPGDFTSVASARWEMVITRHAGKTTLTVRGPETVATAAFSPPYAEFFGIRFKPGAFMPHMPPTVVMDRCDVVLPPASNGSFWLGSSVWQLPTCENVDTFVNRLVRTDLLVYDPLIDSVLRGKTPDLSLRTVQRRFTQATGLTQTALLQIERVRRAIMLLKSGMAALDVAVEAGYYDQAHLIRSLRRYTGMTPTKIADANRVERMSFLYNTSDRA